MTDRNKINVYVRWADTLYNPYAGHTALLEVDPDLTIANLRAAAAAALSDRGAHDKMMLSYNGMKLTDDSATLKQLGIGAEAIIEILW